MTKLDEKEIIKIFQKGFGRQVSEDVETFPLGKKLCVIKTDTLVESTDIPPKMRLYDAARKSIVACVSDFASKGVQPSYCIISVAIPRKYSAKKIKEIADGLRDASKEFGFKILGGDTNEGEELVLSVSFFGIAYDIVHRSGARIGDSIIVTGPFGNASAGLKHVMNGKKAGPKFAKRIKDTVYHPMPRLGFGVSAAKYLSSAMDSSDGLSTTLVEMSAQSKKKFVISSLPMDPELERFARQNRLDVIDLVFNGGEEYEIVATVPQKNLKKVKQIAKSRKISLIEIGSVEKGSGVFLADKKIEAGGWLHFR
ncbi:thiamine-phosphate kinase [Candidatus Nitrosotenuis sp. DW1]|uniref:thiamine-phosphate kinase n=1 Tax=Candidatus Nitrosotenuis sp. DW1 TaxID=2259672 RepID=UPI0015C7DAD0|nr:thiamine-phosphate kinase [Candidatus Nitrosotenuis sp. DW1]QLH09438.1 thiamine-phosphate kinase [Candidatus Nitrosotenuis sp. DW1]